MVRNQKAGRGARGAGRRPGRARRRSPDGAVQMRPCEEVGAC